LRSVPLQTVQEEAIPDGLAGNDIVAQAKAGMGKTAVYVVVALERIAKEDGLQCVVIVHTRELAYQVSKEFERFKTYLDGIVVECIYGGIPLPQQQARLSDNPPHVVVACPGRLKLLIEKSILIMSKIKIFVIDEVDKVLEKMDMREDVQRIFYKTPKNKQTMCFSATMPAEIKATIMKFVRNVSFQNPFLPKFLDILACVVISPSIRSWRSSLKRRSILSALRRRRRWISRELEIHLGS
jgi:ATP-dependent RNA helicase UAP56/SUB2